MNRPERSPGINHDESIDRILRGLRCVKPPQGFESRILVALEARTIVSRPGPFTAPQGWIFATACLALATLAFVLAPAHHTHHAVVKRESASSDLVPKLQELQDADSTPIRMAQQQTHKQIRQTKLIPLAPESAAETTEDTMALTDLHAPSKPAPPMPLTKEEKLLIRIIQRGDPTELATLDPMFRSSEDADSRAAFDRFFAPPSPPKPLPIDIKSTTGDKK